MLFIKYGSKFTYFLLFIKYGSKFTYFLLFIKSGSKLTSFLLFIKSGSKFTYFLLFIKSGSKFTLDKEKIGFEDFQIPSQVSAPKHRINYERVQEVKTWNLWIPWSSINLHLRTYKLFNSSWYPEVVIAYREAFILKYKGVKCPHLISRSRV